MRLYFPFAGQKGDLMNIFSLIAEERILAAQERGEFDNLPGQGKPLRLEDDSAVPPELRMACKILRNSGFAPPEVACRKEIESLLEAVEKGGEEKTRLKRIKAVEALVLRLRDTGRARALSENETYCDMIAARLRLAQEKPDGARSSSGAGTPDRQGKP